MPFDLASARPAAVGGDTTPDLPAPASGGGGGFDLASAKTVEAPTPAKDPNRVENAVRKFFGAPAVGANKDYETVLSADSPFPDVTPASPTMFRDAGRAVVEGGKALLRGGEKGAAAIGETLKTFQQAGTTPTLGQATGRSGAERIMSRVAGSAAPLAAKRSEQLDSLGARVSGLADQLSTTSTPSVAGRAIEKGLSGPGGFVERFKQGQSALYDQVDKYIPGNYPVFLGATRLALKNMNQDIEGAKALSKFFQNPKIKALAKAIQSDTASYGPREFVSPENPFAAVTGGPKGGDKFQMPAGPSQNKLPYESIKKLRTLVGDEISNSNLVSDVPKSKWKYLYSALSQDLETAAKSTGNPAAIKAMDRANTFSRAGYDRIGDVLDKVAKQDIPEKIFQSAVSTSDMRAGATKISTILKSLQPGERDVVRSAFIRRLGIPPTGDEFQASTFLSNWNSMSPQAKNVMFTSQNGELRRALDSVAQVSKTLKNAGPAADILTPHNTGAGITLGTVGAVATGHLATAAAFVGTAAAANLTARLMVNPTFVKWLAKSSRASSPEAARLAVMQLGKIMQKSSQEDQQDAAHYANSVKAALAGGAPQ